MTVGLDFSFLEGIQRFIWGKISDWDGSSLRSRRTAADAGERCEPECNTSTLGVYNSCPSHCWTLTCLFPGARVSASRGSAFGRRERSYFELPRPEHSVMLSLFKRKSLLCQFFKTWVPTLFLYCFRKPLIGCVEKQLLGEHITAILQKGEMLCL